MGITLSLDLPLLLDYGRCMSEEKKSNAWIWWTLGIVVYLVGFLHPLTLDFLRRHSNSNDNWEIVAKTLTFLFAIIYFAICFSIGTIILTNLGDFLEFCLDLIFSPTKTIKIMKRKGKYKVEIGDIWTVRNEKYLITTILSPIKYPEVSEKGEPPSIDLLEYRMKIKTGIIKQYRYTDVNTSHSTSGPCVEGDNYFVGAYPSGGRPGSYILAIDMSADTQQQVCCKIDPDDISWDKLA